MSVASFRAWISWALDECDGLRCRLRDLRKPGCRDDDPFVHPGDVELYVECGRPAASERQELHLLTEPWCLDLDDEAARSQRIETKRAGGICGRPLCRGAVFTVCPHLGADDHRTLGIRDATRQRWCLCKRGRNPQGDQGHDDSCSTTCRYRHLFTPCCNPVCVAGLLKTNARRPSAVATISESTAKTLRQLAGVSTLLWGAVTDDPSVIEQEYLCRELRDDAQVVCGDRHRTAGVGQTPTQRQDGQRVFEVQVGSGFVKQHDIRLGRQAPGDCDALPFATRQPVDPAKAKMSQIAYRHGGFDRLTIAIAFALEPAAVRMASHSRPSRPR